MNTESRKSLSWLFTIAPLIFLTSCHGAIRFMITICEALIRDKQITILPGPTRLLLSNAGLVTSMPLVFGFLFFAAIWIIKTKVKDEPTGLTLELGAHTVVWFIGVNYFVGVSMASFLPWGIAVGR